MVEQDIISHHEHDNRGGFYAERDGVRIGEMTYLRDDPSHITIDHTLVEPALRGGGVARRLLDAAVAWARRTDTKITPLCSYAVVQFRRDKTIGDVLASK